MGTMQDPDVKLTLAVERDAETHQIFLQVVFHHDAENIALGKTTTTWSPTQEELEFLSEAFGLFSTARPQVQNEQEGEDQSQKRDKDSFIRESVSEEEITDAVAAKKKETDEDHVLVQVDQKIIDEAIQRRRPGSENTGTNTETLVDRLTKKKKPS